MDVASRRRPGLTSSVVAGSVWETRMKNDESRGGIKVFNESKEQISNSSSSSNSNGEVKKVNGSTANGKRKNWRSESVDGNLIQNGKRSSCSGGGDEKVKELSVSSDGGMMKKGTRGIKKGKREIEKNPIQSPIHGRKTRSEGTKVGSVMGIEKNKNSRELRKVKSDSEKTMLDGNAVKVVGDGNEEDSGVLRKAKSMPENAVEESSSNVGVDDEIGSDEKCKDLSVDQEEVKSVTEVHENEDKESGDVEDEEEFSQEEEGGGETEDEDEDEEEEEEEEELLFDGQDKEIEVEKESVEIKEITVDEEDKVRPSDGGVVSEEKKVEEVNGELPKPSPKPVVQVNEKAKPISTSNVNKSPPPNSVVKHTTRVYRNVANPPSPSKTSHVFKQPPPVTKRSPVYQNYAKPRSSYGTQDFPEKQSKLQSLVDLIMWRDISKSAFVFGFGTFIIISSSYTRDINVSCISVISYLGLVYLALIFLYRSIICRGYIDIDSTTNYVLGEEEAVWLLKLVLPYMNEFLLNFKALFSGDPATTMKLAVLLFALARCGSSITIWKMAKLGFFGVFTLPRVCSSYSAQLTAYGNFWIRRFHDAWDSCTHKKAVAVAIFTLIWNLCSVVARIWAVFMLFVAFRYYQQSMVRDEWVDNEETAEEPSQQPVGASTRGRGPTIVGSSLKEKKAS